MIVDYSELTEDISDYNNVQTDIETLKTHLADFDKNNFFSILSVNIRSIRANLNLLLAYIAAIDYKYDFIILTETWLDANTNVGLEIPGYISENTYRNKHGGGISIFYLPCFNVSIIPEFSTTHECFESLFLKIVCDDNIVVCLGGVYRPPSCNLNQFNESFKDIILSKLTFQRLIIAGDFNVNLLNDNPSFSEKCFKNLFSEFNLNQLIKHPTRVTSNTNSLIDHIWTSLTSITFTSVTDFPISDHYPVCSLFQLKLDHEPKLITFRTCSENALLKFQENFDHIYYKYMNCQLICPHQMI
jgi:exonuclease III